MSNGLFDLVVHTREPKTGKIIQEQPYVLHCDKDSGWLFERPPGSGFMYAQDNTLIKKPEPVATPTVASAPTVGAEKPAPEVPIQKTTEPIKTEKK
jgi:hypothetical protein